MNAIHPQPALLPDEVLEPLDPYHMQIIQKKQGFRFGIDAVLLADFVRLRKGARCADLGTGSLILPLLLWGNGKAASVQAIEVQPAYADMAARTAQINGLSEQISVHCCNVRDVAARLPTHSCDLVTANPPYQELSGGILTKQEDKLIARFEKEGSLRDFLRCAYHLLRVRGSYYMVHRPDRLCDVLSMMREEKLEPKRLRLVQSRLGEAPSLLLVEGQKDANHGLSVLPPLVLYGADGGYTEEVSRLYHVSFGGTREKKSVL